MRVLGIDTATWTASVGVADAGRVLAERSCAAAPSHGFSLIPLIQDTLAAAGMTPTDLDGIAVSTGPGSFTGLRIGLGTAKGMALALDLEIAGVPTLAALAEVAAAELGTLICPLLDARKGEVYTALFRAEEGSPRRLEPDCAVALNEWLRRIQGPCTFLGDAVGLLPAEVFPQRRWVALPFSDFHPQGSVIARLGAERLRRGEGDDIDGLEPAYVRPPEAELKAARGGTGR